MVESVETNDSLHSSLSRRQLLAGGALVAGQVFLPSQLWAAAKGGKQGALITKRIPSTGERLPVIGIGTNQFGRAPFESVLAVLERMQGFGGTMIDTAAAYGESEAVIGRALAELKLRKRMFISTKFNAAGVNFRFPPGVKPPPGLPPPDPVAGKDSFDRSLQRLQTERIDLISAHFIDSIDPLLPVMRELQKAGKARYIGITTGDISQHAELAEKMRQYPVDFVQVDYSIANRDAEKTVFPVAAERKIAVTIDMPLGGQQGSLLKQIGDRPLPPWAADIGAASWSQFLLKYVVSHPAVTCATPGSTSVEHLADNQLAGHGRLPDATVRKRMEQYWEQNF